MTDGAPRRQQIADAAIAVLGQELRRVLAGLIRGFATGTAARRVS